MSLASKMKTLIDSFHAIKTNINTKDGYTHQDVQAEGLAHEIEIMYAGKDGLWIEKTGNAFTAHTDLTYIPDHTFDGYTEIILDSSTTITDIGDYAFYRVTMSNYDFISNVETIGDYAFYWSSPLMGDYPSDIVPLDLTSCTQLGEHAFELFANRVHCEITLGDHITELPSCCFMSVNCTSIDLGNSLEKICTGALSFGSGFTGGFIFPSSIKTIEEEICSYNTNMTTITFKGTPEYLDWHAFYRCNNISTIYVPWSMDEVPDAPWGARFATVVYNYIPSS